MQSSIMNAEEVQKKYENMFPAFYVTVEQMTQTPTATIADRIKASILREDDVKNEAVFAETRAKLFEEKILLLKQAQREHDLRKEEKNCKKELLRKKYTLQMELKHGKNWFNIVQGTSEDNEYAFEAIDDEMTRDSESSV